MINVGKCKLFLEGMQVPFNSITINEAINQPVQAEVMMPATEQVLKLLPRTVAHIFYMYEGTNYLIFEGEFSGYSFARSSDQRQIGLSFKGLMNNWVTNVIGSTDILPGALATTNYYVIAGASTKDNEIASPGADDKPIKFWYSKQFTVFTILTAIYDNIKKMSNFAELIYATLFDDLPRCSVYYKHLKRVMKIDKNRIFVQDNPKAVEFFSGQVMRQFLNNQTAGMDYKTSIFEILNTIFQYIGFEMLELGAPVKSGDKLYSIIIKPVCDYFLPIKSNTIFTDQISHMQFTRSFDAEPTRIIFNSDPFYINSEQNELLRSITNVIAPAEVWSGGGTDASGRIMGLTEEEKYRGVVLQNFTDTLGLNETYLYYFGAKDKEDQTELQAKVDLAKKKGESQPEIEKLMADSGNYVSKYHKALADRHYADMRLNSRNFIVGVPYTPFRLIGFPAAVIDRQFPTVVGTVASITSNISTDGNAMQTLQLSKARVWWDGITSENGNGFLSETHVAIPEWFDKDTFDAANIGKKFYKNIIPSQPGDARSDMSIACVLDEKDKTGKDMDVMNAAIKKLKADYTALPDTAREEYARRFIYRPLAKEGDVWQFLTGTTPANLDNRQPNDKKAYRNLTDLTVNKITDEEASAAYNNKPFSEERLARVKEIFATQIDAVLS